MLQICFLKSTTIFGHVIEWWGGGGYSHAAIRIPGKNYVIDARSTDRKINGREIPAGVQRRPMTYLKSMPNEWLQLVTTEEQNQKVVDFLKAQETKPYDFIGILDFVIGRVHDRNWRDDKAWFCSELVIAALEQAEIFPKIILNPPVITPGTAACICSSQPGCIVLKEFPSLVE